MRTVAPSRWFLASFCLLVALMQLVHYKPVLFITESNNSVVLETRREKCKAPREGVIILNTFGLLANGLFQVAYANRLASELCWDILYRPNWNNELPSQRGFECLPYSGLPENYQNFTHYNISRLLQEKINLNESLWELMTTEWSRQQVEEGNNDDEFQLTAESDEYYRDWLKEQEMAGMATKVVHNEFDFTGNGTERLVEEIGNPDSHISIISLEAYFIHHDWMIKWMQEIRHWLAMDDSCCYNHPPDDAVVIHVRDFDDAADGSGIEPSVYMEILRHYKLVEHPLWIVCQPKSANSDFVRAIVQASNASTTIVTGRDQYDAFCTLTRAKTLLLSAASTFSQMGAALADPNVVVHFPIPKLEEPRVTLKIPTWKYHLVAKSRNIVEEFDVAHDKLRVTMS